jgi:hypothetical protein
VTPERLRDREVANLAVLGVDLEQGLDIPIFTGEPLSGKGYAAEGASSVYN